MHPQPLARLAALATIAITTLSAQAQSDLAAQLEPVRAKYQLPGLTAVVVKGGRIVGEGAVGVRRQGTPTPLQKDDPVNIGSCTKTFTALIAARLVDRHILSWGLRVRDVFPNHATFDPAFPDVTLEQLLAHRGGVEFGATWERRHGKELAQQTGTIDEVRRWAAEAALKDAPEKPPGTFLYSNHGYTVAAVMMELASKKTWETLVQEEVFVPLRLSTARLGCTFVSDAVPPVSVVGHDIANSQSAAVPRPAPSADRLRQYQGANGPAGFVICTMRDFARFLTVFSRGGRGYLTPATMRKLCTPVEAGEPYAMGVRAYSRPWAAPGQALNHGGDIFGVTSTYWVAPSPDLIIALTTNCHSLDGANLKALDELSGTLIKRFQAAPLSGPAL